MGSSRLVWTPIGSSGSQNADFAVTGLQRLAGGIEADAYRAETPAGRAVVLWHDSWSRYELHVDAIDRVTDNLLWLQLQSFVAHATAGAEFAFQIDSAKTYSAPLTAGAAEGVTSLTVGSTTGLTAGDTIEIEHGTDPRRQSTTVSGPPTSTTFSISPGLHHAMPIGSTVRHFQYYARARVDDVAFEERDAGLGANLWDFRLRFRTFRG